jgi:hypothetical protein
MWRAPAAGQIRPRVFAVVVRAGMGVTMSRRMIRILVVGLVVAGAGCSAAPRQRAVKMGPVETGAGTLTAARQYLEGRWTLESFDVFPPGKDPIRVKGDGTLLYDEYGNLKIDIRTDPATGDALSRVGINVTGGVIASEGRTVINLQDHTITYVIEGQTGHGFERGGPLGIDRPRHWVVDGNLLTLTTRDEAGKDVSVAKWRKMP